MGTGVGAPPSCEKVQHAIPALNHWIRAIHKDYLNLDLNWTILGNMMYQHLSWATLLLCRISGFSASSFSLNYPMSLSALKTQAEQILPVFQRQNPVTELTGSRLGVGHRDLTGISVSLCSRFCSTGLWHSIVTWCKTINDYICQLELQEMSRFSFTDLNGSSWTTCPSNKQRCKKWFRQMWPELPPKPWSESEPFKQWYRGRLDGLIGDFPSLMFDVCSDMLG